MGPTGDRHLRVARGRSKSPQQEEMVNKITDIESSIPIRPLNVWLWLTLIQDVTKVKVRVYFFWFYQNSLEDKIQMHDEPFYIFCHYF